MTDESVLHISLLQVFYYYYFFSTLIVCFLGPRCSCSLGEQFLSLSGRPGVWHIPIRLKKFQHLLTSGLKEDVCTCECVWRWWRVLVVVGGWGRIHGNTPPPPPLGPKRQSLTHTHVHTCTRSTTGPAEPDQYFSPFKEQNSENGFSAPRLQPCFRPWVFTLNTQSAKWRGFFVLTQNNSWPESFLFFHFTVLMDPFSPGRTSVLLSIFVWFPPIFLSLFSYFLLLPSLHFLSLPLRVSDRVRLHSASSLFVSPCGWPRLRSQQVSLWSPGASKSISEAEGLDWPWPSGPVGWLEEGWVVWLWGSPWLLSVGKMEESSL